MLGYIKRQISLARNLVTFTALKTTGQGLGMIAPLFIAAFFEPALFASYSLAKMIVFFFTALLVLSSQRPFIVYANQERAESGRINKRSYTDKSP